MNFYSVFKHLAFKLDPENVHDLAITSAKHAPALADLFSPVKHDDKYKFSHSGLDWEFPVGLAAGFDKNALAINFFKKLGLGAIEVGTVTKLEQIGNDRPRIFRHSKINSLQNSMGFPNAGSDQILKNIQENYKNDICLGVNIGKNKLTSEQDTPAEYAYLYKMFASYCNYLVVNISSPNTPGLRGFQKKELLTPILNAIKAEQKSLYKPVFIKIAPDMQTEDLKMICELSKELSFSGIIATNTTTQHNFGAGGLSGQYIKKISAPIRLKACEFLREDPTQTIIGVGGISTYDEIKEFWQAGGSFTQVYTSLIFEGPLLLKKIAREIDKDLLRLELKNVQELFQYYQPQK